MSGKSRINIIVKCYVGLIVICLLSIRQFGMGEFEEYFIIVGIFFISSLLSAYVLFHYGDRIGKLSKLDLCFGIFILYRLGRMISVEGINEILLYSEISLIFLYLLCRIVDCSRWIISILIIGGLTQSILAFLQLLSVVQGDQVLFRITGAFTNPGPLGGFLAIAFVMSAFTSVYFQWKKKIYWCIFLIIITTCIGYILILSDSRAAWISTLSALVLSIRKYFPSQFPIINKEYIFPVVIIAILLVIYLVLYKWDSAMGRILVWRVSADMIADKPVLGHGTDSFRAKYMLYQSEYFKKHPESPFIKVADDVGCAYNELIEVLVEGGIIGLGLFIMVLVLLWYSNGNILIQGGLFSLIIFSLFSYPFDLYVFKTMFVMMCASTSVNEIKLINFQVRQKPFRKLIFICWSIIGLNTSSVIYLMKEKDHYEILKKNPAFMSQYAKQIYLEALPAKALPVLLDMTKIFPCTDLYCDIGKIYEKLYDYDKAEAYYKKASFMVPSRIRPQWYLFYLYYQRNDIRQAEYIARKILETPPKIENTVSIRVYAYLENFLVTKDTTRTVLDF